MFQRVRVRERERCESKATPIGLCRYGRQHNPLQQSKNLFEYHSSSCSCGHLLHHQDSIRNPRRWRLGFQRADCRGLSFQGNLNTVRSFSRL
ncbi:hypothetical protein HanIR_Chr01g0037611 [Helianthus annuus]|nr:hypothetical protein HanIR_Chr01g0037611 [Helianthus annuus]